MRVIGILIKERRGEMKGDSGKLRDEGRKVIVVRLNEEEELV